MCKEKVCPCPNLDCPNHGVCECCASRHLKIGTLNYCGFYSILPLLEEAIQLSPESDTAKKIQTQIDRQSSAYSALLKKHKLCEKNQAKLREEKRNFSSY